MEGASGVSNRLCGIEYAEDACFETLGDWDWWYWHFGLSFCDVMPKVLRHIIIGFLKPLRQRFVTNTLISTWQSLSNEGRSVNVNVIDWYPNNYNASIVLGSVLLKDSERVFTLSFTGRAPGWWTNSVGVSLKCSDPSNEYTSDPYNEFTTRYVVQLDGTTLKLHPHDNHEKIQSSFASELATYMKQGTIKIHCDLHNGIVSFGSALDPMLPMRPVFLNITDLEQYVPYIGGALHVTIK